LPYLALPCRIVKIGDETCPLCSPVDELLLWRDAFCRVIWVDDAHYPGFCRVVLNAHVKEMTDLLAGAATALDGRGVRSGNRSAGPLLQPDKINLASLGNVVPHVHWHVIPAGRTMQIFRMRSGRRHAGPTPAINTVRLHYTDSGAD
jgi:diadenosine tetraphosphate (Ap4A) HIT family hydrolase